MSRFTSRDRHGLVPGSVVGPWRIIECLDAGGCGVVYRAQRAGHPRAPFVALKLARRPRDARFEREAEFLQLCLHPNVPRFEDRGFWTGADGHHYPYIVMEWVEGLPLYEWIAATQRTSRDVLRVLAQVASALAAAHAQGVLHRDVKGDNIRITPEGRAVLLDWGSGWRVGARPLTDTIVPPGTRPYRPPEQCAFMWHFRRDEDARWESTPADDLYSLGVTLYRAVTRRYPPPCTLAGAPIEREVRPPSDFATVCVELEMIILRLLSEEREERGTAEKLAWEVQGVADTAGPQADTPIVPTARARRSDEEEWDSSEAYSSESEEEERSCPYHGPVVPAWLFLASLAVMVVLLVMLARASRRPAAAEPEFLPEPVAEEWHAPDIEAPDAGVGEQVLASEQDVPSVSVPTYVLGLPMPKGPLPRQKRPPCEPKTQRVINGGCWFGPVSKSPCGPEAFDYDDGCYLPIINAPLQPTSEEP